MKESTQEQEKENREPLTENSADSETLNGSKTDGDFEKETHGVKRDASTLSTDSETVIFL